MIYSLKLQNVGPAPRLELEFGTRLNLITGDNGLGKSFLLDTIWWALTRKWPQELNSQLTNGYVARPTIPKELATIEFDIESKTKRVRYQSTYSRIDQAWTGKQGRPWNPGLVIYAQADGGFSVWDPARNYWKSQGKVDVQDRPAGFVFTSKDVWDGLDIHIDGRSTRVCNGLVQDWCNWSRENGRQSNNVSSVLHHLSPSTDAIDQIRTAGIARLSAFDSRDIPAIRVGQGEAIPILYASAGIRRISALAYMLLWAWEEHHVASQAQGVEPTHQVVFLVDEIECHLHPRWQRSILRTLQNLVALILPQSQIQIVTATHSPLVLASLEPVFDASQDAWFDLDLNPQTHFPEITKRPFVRKGSVSHWLTSEAFDLKQDRSLDAEVAMTRALELYRRTSVESSEVIEVDRLLRSALGAEDRFLSGWQKFLDDRGLTSPIAQAVLP